MNKRWGAAAVAAAALVLSGCASSGDGGASASNTVGASSTSTKAVAARATRTAKPKLTPKGIVTIEDLRAAVQKAGVSCPDTSWKPNLAPDVEHASAEGVCADALTLVVFKDKSTVGQSAIRFDLALLNAQHALDSPDPVNDEILAGPGWGALGAKPTIAMIRAALGGSGI